MSSAIGLIVDYTAARAATLVQDVRIANGDLVGVRSAFGAGQGVLADPLRPGSVIQPCPEKPSEPLQHWSLLPDAPAIEWLSQTSLDLTWTIPMRLYLQRSDAATAAQVCLPFYDAYLGAFAIDPTLGGLVVVSRIRSIKAASDESWYWLDMEMEAEEVVSY